MRNDPLLSSLFQPGTATLDDFFVYTVHLKGFINIRYQNVSIGTISTMEMLVAKYDGNQDIGDEPYNLDGSGGATQLLDRKMVSYAVSESTNFNSNAIYFQTWPIDMKLSNVRLAPLGDEAGDTFCGIKIALRILGSSQNSYNMPMTYNLTLSATYHLELKDELFVT